MKVLLYSHLLILTFTYIKARNSTQKSTNIKHISTLNDQSEQSDPDAFLSESAKNTISKFYDKYCKIYENPTRETLVDVFANDIILITNTGEIVTGKEEVIKLFVNSFPETFIHCEYNLLFVSGSDDFPFVIAEIRSYSHKKELKDSHITISELRKTQFGNYEIIALTYQINKVKEDGVIDEYVSHKKGKNSKAQSISPELRDSPTHTNHSEAYTITDNYTTVNYPIEFISKYIHSKYNFSTKGKEISNKHRSIKSEMSDYEDLSQVTDFLNNDTYMATDKTINSKSSISLIQYIPVNTSNITSELLQNQPFAILKQGKRTQLYPTTTKSNDKEYNNYNQTDHPSIDTLDNEEEYYYYYDENSKNIN